MLKRLFISLIILSALTSDASAFSAYMLSAGLSREGWLNHFEDSKILPEAAGKLYIASTDEIMQARAIQYRLVFVMPDDASIRCEISCYNGVDYKTLKVDNREITFSADLSPPHG